MANAENELQRSVRDVGISVVEVLKTRLSQAVIANELPIGREHLPALTAFLDTHGTQAMHGALKTFYAKFDEYKDSLDPKG